MLAEINAVGKLVYGYGLHIILVDIIKYGLYIACSIILYICLVDIRTEEIAEKDIEHIEKLCLYLHFIKRSFVVVFIYKPADTDGKLIIMRCIRRNNYRIDIISVEKRRQIFYCTGVRIISREHIQVKDNRSENTAYSILLPE